MANIKWEYKKTHSETPVSSAVLNIYGQEGWELCHDPLNKHGVYYYTFKRPIVDSVIPSISRQSELLSDFKRFAKYRWNGLHLKDLNNLIDDYLKSLNGD